MVRTSTTLPHAFVQGLVVTLNSAHFPSTEASIQISGTDTAYFPRGQDCLTTTTSSQLRDAVLKVFADELKAHGVNREPQHLCLVCGRTWAGGEIYCTVLWVLKFINYTKHFCKLSFDLTTQTKEVLSACFFWDLSLCGHCYFMFRNRENTPV